MPAALHRFAGYLDFTEASGPTKSAPGVLIEALDLLPKRNHDKRLDLLGEVACVVLRGRREHFFSSPVSCTMP